MKKEELKVHDWDIDQIYPNSWNPNMTSKRVDEAIRESIGTYGMVDPITCRRHPELDEALQIIDGEHRLEACKEMGYKTVPVVVLDINDANAKKLTIIANETRGRAEPNSLAQLLDDISKELDLDELGLGLPFSQKEIEEMLVRPTEEGLTDEDETPDAPEIAEAKEGDVWILGNHRLMCGDSTNGDHVSQLLQKVEPHLMVTDPPYGVNYDPSHREGGAALGVVLNDHNADWSEAWQHFKGDVAYVWHASTKTHIVAESLINQKFNLRTQIIWAKSQHTFGRGDYHEQKEPCWYCVRDKKTGHWNGDRKQTTLWFIDKPMKNETGHSTQKPVECMRKPIENNSSVGQVVYEPFCGSGTTIIAAETTGRICYAMELNPPYVDVAIKRWQDFTGQQAILESSGLPFPIKPNA